MKFVVEDEEHSKRIQKYLFSLGYTWGGGQIYQNTEAKYLYARRSTMGLSFGYSTDVFSNDSRKLTAFNDKIRLLNMLKDFK